MSYEPITSYFREQLGLPQGVFVCDLPAGTRIAAVASAGTFVAVHPEHAPLLIHPWGPQPLCPIKALGVAMEGLLP